MLLNVTDENLDSYRKIDLSFQLVSRKCNIHSFLYIINYVDIYV